MTHSICALDYKRGETSWAELSPVCLNWSNSKTIPGNQAQRETCVQLPWLRWRCQQHGVSTSSNTLQHCFPALLDWQVEWEVSLAALVTHVPQPPGPTRVRINQWWKSDLTQDLTAHTLTPHSRCPSSNRNCVYKAFLKICSSHLDY